MRIDELHIQEPCHQDWDAMESQGQRRFCDACTKHVHDLSAMTETEARALLDAPRPQDGLCIRYTSAPDGRVVFRDAPAPSSPLARQWAGLQRLVAASAMIVPLLVGGVAAAQDATPTDTPPEAELLVTMGEAPAPEATHGPPPLGHDVVEHFLKDDPNAPKPSCDDDDPNKDDDEDDDTKGGTSSDSTDDSAESATQPPKPIVRPKHIKMMGRVAPPKHRLR